MFSQYIRSGETADFDEYVVVNGHKKLSMLILEHKAEDVYNIDTAFFTVCNQIKQFQVGLIKDAKNVKIVHLWCFLANANEFDKRTLIVIRKSAKPR